MSGTSLDEFLQLLRERRMRLPFEIGAFVALSFVDESVEAPRYARPRDLVLRDDGSLDLSRTHACDEKDALESAHALLAALLAASGEGVPPMLSDIVSRPAASIAPSLARLRDELEAALVPLNRDASRRVLSRSLRDVRRTNSVPPKRGESDDASLDAFLEGRPEAPTGPEVVIRSHELDRSVRPAPDAGGKSSIFRDEAGGLEEEREDGGRSLMPLAVVALLVLAALGAVAVLTRSPSDDVPAQATPDGRRPPAAAEAPVTTGELEVVVAPEGAVVRMFVGRVPTVVDDVPVGVATELLALSDDGRAIRYVVPADAAFQDVDGLPELAVTLPDSASSAASALDGTDLRVESMGRPTGRLGRLRVSGGLEGARLHRTLGFAPSARLRDVRTARALELLVSAAGHVTQRVVVQPSDFRDQGGERRARIEVQLRPQ